MVRPSLGEGAASQRGAAPMDFQQSHDQPQMQGGLASVHRIKQHQQWLQGQRGNDEARRRSNRRVRVSSQMS